MKLPNTQTVFGGQSEFLHLVEPLDFAQDSPEYLLNTAYETVGKPVDVGYQYAEGANAGRDWMGQAHIIQGYAERLLTTVDPHGDVGISTLLPPETHNGMDSYEFNQAVLKTRGAYNKVVPLVESPAEVLLPDGSLDYTKYYDAIESRYGGTNGFTMNYPHKTSDETDVFMLDPAKQFYVNDKANLPEFVPAEFRARQYAEFSDLSDFALAEVEAGSIAGIPLDYPVMVKAASLSGGEGVIKCENAAELIACQAMKELAGAGRIVIDECIPHDATLNLGVQYQIRPDGSVNITGSGQQIVVNGTEHNGSFFGDNDSPEIEKAERIMMHEILPKMAATGVRGYGSIDFLVSKRDGLPKFIDINHRPTGALIAAQQKVMEPQSSVLSTTLKFQGPATENRAKVAALVDQGIVKSAGYTEVGENAVLNAVCDGTVEAINDKLEVAIRKHGLASLEPAQSFVKAMKPNFGVDFHTGNRSRVAEAA